jgi:hypothetical protein
MEGTSPWGYELILRSYVFPVTGPRIPHVDALATFVNLVDGVAQYSVTPSIADHGIGTVLKRRVILFPPTQYALFSFLTFFGLNQGRFETGGSTIRYSPLGDGPVAWTEKPFTIPYEDEEAAEATRYEVDVEIPPHCGFEWPP